MFVGSCWSGFESDGVSTMHAHWMVQLRGTDTNTSPGLRSWNVIMGGGLNTKLVCGRGGDGMGVVPTCVRGRGGRWGVAGVVGACCWGKYGTHGVPKTARQ